MRLPVLLCTLVREHGSNFCVGAALLAAHDVGGGDNNFFRRLKRCVAAAAALTRRQTGRPGTRSQHPNGLTGAVICLERGAKGTGSTAYLPGLAADAAGNASDLATGRESSPRGAHAAPARSHMPSFTRRCDRRAAPQRPPQHPSPLSAPPLTHLVPLGSLPQA